MRRIAVVGSRSFVDYDRLCAELTRVCWNHFAEKDEPCEIVSGGARGADWLAERYARSRGWPVRVFRAEWDKWGRAAGIIRNRDIVRHADLVVAFWDGKSRGTAHTIETAKREAVPCIVVRVDKKTVVCRESAPV